MRRLLLVFVCLSMAGFAQQPAPSKFSSKLWWASLAADAAANAADAYTSLGRYELNPLLRSKNGMFDPAKGAAFKAGLWGSSAVSQYLYLRKHPRMARVFETINFGKASAFGATAFHNTRVPLYRPH